MIGRTAFEQVEFRSFDVDPIPGRCTCRVDVTEQRSDPAPPHYPQDPASDQKLVMDLFRLFILEYDSEDFYGCESYLPLLYTFSGSDEALELLIGHVYPAYEDVGCHL